MAYNPETVNNKLTTLQETQDSVCTVASWIIYHRRHAQEIASIWVTKLKEVPAHKKLNLIYLANEVVQTSRNRKKEEFINAFAPIIGGSTISAYRETPAPIAEKIRRVVQVWKERSVFPEAVLKQIEVGLAAADKDRTDPVRVAAASSSSRPTIPSELREVVAAQTSVSTKVPQATSLYKDAKAQFGETSSMVGPATVQASQLATLLKTLDAAHVAVQGAINDRTTLIKACQSIIEMNSTAIAGEQAFLEELASKRSVVADRKAMVEHALATGTELEQTTLADSWASAQEAANPRSRTPELRSPVVEELTPPPPSAAERATVPSATPAPAPAAPVKRLHPAHGQAAFPDSDDDDGYTPSAGPQQYAPPPAANNGVVYTDKKTAEEKAQELLNSLTAFQKPPSFGQLRGFNNAFANTGDEMEGISLDADVMDLLKEEL
ncbi:DUF618-domain-containing protein [Ascobolus immersus RN42]|uniref:DUF618-domain-containing protein n=1 Tax=Ascobolus immersus RN42 TaxID=1160509 RepID=A0A3N4IMT9_ASCIM|nr:DUF618-domain-containing protein [Ascobolus immersus RN42]